MRQWWMTNTEEKDKGTQVLSLFRYLEVHLGRGICRPLRASTSSGKRGCVRGKDSILSDVGCLGEGVPGWVRAADAPTMDG